MARGAGRARREVVALLALSDDDAPSIDARNAAARSPLGVLCFACTPEGFPELMAAALEQRGVGAWADAQRPIFDAPHG